MTDAHETRGDGVRVCTFCGTAASPDECPQCHQARCSYCGTGCICALQDAMPDDGPDDQRETDLMHRDDEIFGE